MAFELRKGMTRMNYFLLFVAQRMKSNTSAVNVPKWDGKQ